jgi:Flp pilus assembly pilin Flp
MLKILREQLICDEDGLTTVEYALLLALITIASLAAWQGLADAIPYTTEQTGAVLNG